MIWVCCLRDRDVARRLSARLLTRPVRESCARVWRHLGPSARRALALSRPNCRLRLGKLCNTQTTRSYSDKADRRIVDKKYGDVVMILNRDSVGRDLISSHLGCGPRMGRTNGGERYQMHDAASRSETREDNGGSEAVSPVLFSFRTGHRLKGVRPEAALIRDFALGRWQDGR